MNYGLDRRRGIESGVGTSYRQKIPVEAHVGTALDFNARLTRAAREAAHGIGTEMFREKIWEWTIDERLLWVAFRQLQQFGGQAPGVDGLMYDDLPEVMMRGELRRTRDSLRENTFRASPLRRMLIPKPDSDKQRELLLPTIFDRIVGKGIAMAIGPYLDERLSDSCFAYRPQMGPLTAVAHAMHHADRNGRYVWLNVDLKDAFNSVPRARLLDLLRSELANANLINVIGALIDNGKRQGIPMGQPLCPLLFNHYADKFVDQPLNRLLPDVVHVRFADNSLLLHHTVAEARRTLERLQTILRPTGLKLKAGWELEDVRTGRAVNFVGVQVDRQGNQWNPRLAETSWRRLKQELVFAQKTPMAPLTAFEMLNGWMQYRGFLVPEGSEEEVIARIRQTAMLEGFLELPSEEELLASIQGSRQQWEQILHAEGQLIEQRARGGGSAPPPMRNSRHAGRAGATRSTPPVGDFVLSTDGSALGPNGPGGWAFILRRDGRPVGVDCGGRPEATNNQMELSAVLNGLGEIPDGSSVLVRSDSRYVVDNARDNLQRWLDSGALRGRLGAVPEVANADWWLAIAVELDRLRCQFEWVQGHSGDPDNEDCDRRAKMAARQVAAEQCAGEW